MKRKIELNLLFILIVSSLFFTNCEKNSSLPVDGDGNEYDTLVIGTQVWLGENLKTTKYNNGISIPLTIKNEDWISKNSAAFCWYNNQPEKFKDDYGALYNWWAVQVSALCPVGFHVPTKEEWQTLIDYLGGEEIAGGKLKAAGNQFWQAENDATNLTGFTAMPGGMRNHDDGSFIQLRSYGYWWSSSPGINDKYGTRVKLHYSLPEINLSSWFKQSGFSVRCIKSK